MIDLSKVPVGLTLTSADAQLVLDKLNGYEPNQTEAHRLSLIKLHIHKCTEASLRKHHAAGVRPALVLVPCPVRTLPVRGEVA